MLIVAGRFRPCGSPPVNQPQAETQHPALGIVRQPSSPLFPHGSVSTLEAKGERGSITPNGLASMIRSGDRQGTAVVGGQDQVNRRNTRKSARNATVDETKSFLGSPRDCTTGADAGARSRGSKAPPVGGPNCAAWCAWCAWPAWPALFAGQVAAQRNAQQMP